MTNRINKRVLEISDYMIKTNKTIREIAMVFNVSKSTVHKDLNDRLIVLDINRYNLVKKILNDHTAIRHIRGGQSTKNVFMLKKRVNM